MPLTQNDPSPCGGGKIKYCCKDLAADLEKVSRTIEADQRLAAVQQLDVLIASKGPRAPLLALKADVLLDLGDMERFEQAAEEFLSRFPENGVALAMSAIVAAGREEVRRAVDQMQSSLKAIYDGQIASRPKGARPEDKLEILIPDAVYDALGVVSQALIVSGHLPAARMHVLLQLRFSGGSDRRSFELFNQLNDVGQEPPLLREDWRLISPEEGLLSPKIPESRRESLVAAIGAAGGGLWQACVDELHACLKYAPFDPLVLRNLAVLHGYLADDDAACAAWRQYSCLPNIPVEDAIEAEAIAQLLDPVQETVEQVIITLPIEQPDKALERLQSDGRLNSLPVDLTELVEPGEPPPKAAFWLLDKPVAAASEGLTLAAASRVLAEVHFFGRQTDRAARMEVTTDKSDRFQETTGLLQEILGEHWQAPTEEAKVGETPLAQSLFSFGWRLPDDASPQLRQQLVSQSLEQSLFERWPAQPFSVLGGKTPLEAAADPKLTLRVLAAILNLELFAEQKQWNLDFNALRQQLKLPLATPIDPRAVNVQTLPLYRYSRLMTDKLTDDALFACWSRVLLAGLPAAKRKLAEEIIRRPPVEPIAKAMAYGELAKLATRSDEALVYLQSAQQAAEEQKQSPAPWLLSELALRWQRGELAQWREVLARIQSKHAKEPGVSEQLVRMLVGMGVLAPDGSPGPVLRAAASAEASAAAASPAPAPGRLWTPGQAPAETPAAAGSKSGLWLPGT